MTVSPTASLGVRGGAVERPAAASRGRRGYKRPTEPTVAAIDESSVILLTLSLRRY